MKGHRNRCDPPGREVTPARIGQGRPQLPPPQQWRNPSQEQSVPSLISRFGAISRVAAFELRTTSQALNGRGPTIGATIRIGLCLGWHLQVHQRACHEPLSRPSLPRGRARSQFSGAFRFLGAFYCSLAYVAFAAGKQRWPGQGLAPRRSAPLATASKISKEILCRNVLPFVVSFFQPPRKVGRGLDRLPATPTCFALVETRSPRCSQDWL